jgi:hypothetical protein
MILGEVPYVKVREHITEAEAFETEIALIKAIGRFPFGPLVNMTDGGEGSSGHVRSLRTRLLIAEGVRRWAQAHPELTSERSRRNQANRTPAQRSAQAKLMNDAQTTAARSARAKLYANRIPKERRIEISKYANSFLTDDQRRKSLQEWLSTATPAEKQEAARKAVASRRSNGNMSNLPCLGSKWINNGLVTKRLIAGSPLLDGWVYGRLTLKSKGRKFSIEHKANISKARLEFYAKQRATVPDKPVDSEGCK